MELTDRQLALLNDHVEGTLDDADRAQVQAMLDQDPNLATLVEQMQRDRAQLMNLPVHTPPGDAGSLAEAALAQADVPPGRVAGRIGPGANAKDWTRTWWHVLSGLAIAAVIMFAAGVVLSFLGQGGSPQTTTVTDQPLALAEQPAAGEREQARAAAEPLRRERMAMQRADATRRRELDAAAPAPVTAMTDMARTDGDADSYAAFGVGDAVADAREPVTIVTASLPATRRQLDDWMHANAVSFVEESPADTQLPQARLKSSPSAEPPQVRQQQLRLRMDRRQVPQLVEALNQPMSQRVLMPRQMAQAADDADEAPGLQDGSNAGPDLLDVRVTIIETPAELEPVAPASEPR